MKPTLAFGLALLTLAGCQDEPKNAARPLPTMIDIPGGQFQMGAGAEADAQQGKPQHGVDVPSFRLAKTEITFAQYDAFAKAAGRALPQDEGFGRGKRPVINISRADMLAYIDWLNETSGETGFRLPSEAEWEYAMRAGTTSAYYWGDEANPNFVNSANNSGPDSYPTTAPVKSFPPNAYGLYDMAGNVWEATADCSHPDYKGAPVDGSARTDGPCTAYIVRGGGYAGMRRAYRVTARAAAGNSFASMSLGFRVAQDPLPDRTP